VRTFGVGLGNWTPTVIVRGRWGVLYVQTGRDKSELGRFGLELSQGIGDDRIGPPLTLEGLVRGKKVRGKLSLIACCRRQGSGCLGKSGSIQEDRGLYMMGTSLRRKALLHLGI